MVNFYLNIDVSGSAHVNPKLATIQVKDINIINDTTITVIMKSGILAKGDNMPNLLLEVKKSSNPNAPSFIKATSIQESDGSNLDGTTGYNTFDFIFNSSSFISDEKVTTAQFVLADTNITGAELDGALINMNVPNITLIEGDGDFTSIPMPSDASPALTMGTIVDRNNWSVTILNANLITAEDHSAWYHIDVYVQPANGGTPIQLNDTSIVLSGIVNTTHVESGFYDKRYFENGDTIFIKKGFQNVTPDDDTQPNAQSSTLAAVTVAAAPATDKILAEINVSESVFQNVFKFRLLNNRSSTKYFPSSAQGVFSMKEPADNSDLLNFQYKRDGDNETPSLDATSFDDEDEWTWRKGTDTSYQPWVDDSNLIAKAIFSNVATITADIFKNENTLTNNIKSFYGEVIDVIVNSLKGKTITTGTQTVPNSTTLIKDLHTQGGPYTVDQSDYILKQETSTSDSAYIDTDNNIPQFLLESILLDDPNRLTYDDVGGNYVIDWSNTTTAQNIPLKAGDKLIIEFRGKVKYADPFKDSNSQPTTHVNTTNQNKFLVITLN